MKLPKMHLEIILILTIILLLTRSDFNSINQNKDVSRVCIKENCFSVELAITEREKQKGLMNREHLDKDKGMLFIYDIPIKSDFWMKNTLIPLDIIWINRNNKIIHIITAYPCKESSCQIYTSDKEALYVLEINANLTKELNIKEEDFVLIT